MAHQFYTYTHTLTTTSSLPLNFSSSQLVNLKASAVELLEVMLEETSDKSSELVEEIAGSLDILALHDTLADFYELANDPEVKQLGFSEEAERGLFRTYHVLVHLGDYKIPSSIKEQIGECEGVVRCAWHLATVQHPKCWSQSLVG